VGLVAMLLLAWLLSEERGRFPWRFVAVGLGVQITLAVLFLKLPIAATVFGEVNRAVTAIQEATQAGTSFVFGFLGGAPLTYEETRAGASIVFAFRFLPLILLVSALGALLTYWRVLPALVRAFAWLFERTLGLGAPSRCHRPRTSFSAWSSRPCSSGRIWLDSIATSCSQ
jgi:CNT family concentrative nucleoside transporter